MSNKNLDNILHCYTEHNVKTRREMKTKALECWQPIVRSIIKDVKRTDDRFASLRTFSTGSYYEGTKVKNSNEFDLMLVMEDLSIRYIGYRIRETSCIVYMNGWTSYFGGMNTGNSATDYTPSRTPLGGYISFIRFLIHQITRFSPTMAFSVVSTAVSQRKVRLANTSHI